MMGPPQIGTFGMISKELLNIYFHENPLTKFSYTSGPEPVHQDLSIAHIFGFFRVDFDILPNF
jgi:hypothetical protein